METALHIRNILLRAFIINYVVIFFVWLLTFTPFYPWALRVFFDFSRPETQWYVAEIIGFWKIIGFVFFLIPAIAIHWEYVWAGKEKRVRRK